MTWLKRLPPAASAAAGLVAVVPLMGWIADVPSFRDFGIGPAVMQPSTATAVLLLAAAGPFRRRMGSVAAMALAGAVVALLLALGPLLLHLAEVANPLAPPAVLAGTGPMSFPSAVALTLLAFAVLFEGRNAVAWCAVIPVAIGVTGAAGFLYSVAIGTPTSYTGMSLPSAVSYALLGTAALFRLPDHPLVRELQNPGITGIITRQLLVAAWMIPLAAGLIRLEGERIGAYGPEVGVGIMVIVTIVTLTVTSMVTVEALRRAERYRDASEQRLRNLFDEAPVGLFRSLPDGTIKDANPSLARLLRTDRATLLTRNAASFYADPDDRSRFLQMLRESAPGTVMEVRMVASDGTPLWCEIRGRMVRDAESGALDYLEGSIADITQRRNAEADRQRSQRLEAAGQLAGSIAHDFNNLLTVVAANGSLLLRALAPDDPHRDEVQQMVAATDRAAALTRQLLVFSRRQLLTPQVVSPADIVAGLRAMLGSVVGERIMLDVAVDDALWPVRVDVGQIEQVLTNLVINARDAMPTGGRITIELSNARLDDAYGYGHLHVVPGDYVRLAVSDTGTGIPADVLPHIFEPYFSTKAERGTGLGLSGVYGIVRQSGGHVFVYTEVGQGSTFKIYLPRVEGRAERLTGSRVAPIAGGSETILVVDDNTAVRRAVRRLLEHLNYRVLEAEDAPAARAAFQAHGAEIHLLLTDVVMPDTSGPELVRELREQGLPFRVLYATGYTDETVLRHSLVEPGSTVLQKPVSIEDLARKVRSVLDAPAA